MVNHQSTIQPEISSLYIVATPIGNVHDISQRACDILAQVDVIAAEDTRKTRVLLDKLNISQEHQNLISYHDHNEEARAQQLCQKLIQGQNIALVSDAGTPLLSDPGYRLVKMAHENNIKVVPVPGACAAIAALSVAGLATDRFYFEGFIPAKGSKRDAVLQRLKKETATTILYESPHRIKALIADLSEVLGEHRLCVYAREITKTFETIKQLTLGALAQWLDDDNNQQKGEIVLVLNGAESKEAQTQSVDVENILRALAEELPVNRAAKVAAKITGINKKALYSHLLEIKC